MDVFSLILPFVPGLDTKIKILFWVLLLFILKTLVKILANYSRRRGAKVDRKIYENKIKHRSKRDEKITEEDFSYLKRLEKAEKKFSSKIHKGGFELGAEVLLIFILVCANYSVFKPSVASVFPMADTFLSNIIRKNKEVKESESDTQEDTGKDLSTEIQEKEEKEEKEKEEEKEIVPGTEAERTYNTDCTMNLSLLNEKIKLRNGTTENEIILEEEVIDKVFFGLLKKQESGDGDVLYPYDEKISQNFTAIEKKIDAAICSNNSNMLDCQEESYQHKVLNITGEFEKFFDETRDKQENPPAYKGSLLWYDLLPDVNRLITVLCEQQKFYEDSPDIELAQLLYNGHVTIASECNIQGCDTDIIVYHYIVALYFLIEKLQFENVNIDNCYKTLKDMNSIYDTLSSLEISDKIFSATGGKAIRECSELIAYVLNTFIENNLTIKDLANDPIEVMYAVNQ